jgi:hypothetical protein
MTPPLYCVGCNKFRPDKTHLLYGSYNVIIPRLSYRNTFKGVCLLPSDTIRTQCHLKVSENFFDLHLTNVDNQKFVEPDGPVLEEFLMSSIITLRLK